MVSDDARSTYTKIPKRKRVLVVSNASPESSEESPEPQPKQFNHPRPLPSPASSYQYAKPIHTHGSNSHIPLPLQTDIRYPPSNPSNPALSSPSSASSPAADVTPPPSTPGPGPPMSDEGTMRQGMIKSIPRQANERIRSARRYSSSGSRPPNSPTTSVDTAISGGYRSSPMVKVNVLVTTDAENLQIVDITGAMTAAFIRERIFTKLQISDEDQANFSIYRTEIGQYAIGDALTDEQLFSLCKQNGDQTGKLKLLVSHSSAFVHEPGPYDQPSATVNTIPPPVLPQQTLYAPLRPRRIRQGSQSSTSEPHHAEIGYEASVSDDLDHGDVEGGPREAHILRTRALPIPNQRPPSPNGHRARSPAGLLSPERHRDPYSIGTFPGSSPQGTRFADDPHPLPPLPPEAHLPQPDTPIERERSRTNDGQISFGGGWRRVDRDDRERERSKRRDIFPKDSGRSRRAEQEEGRRPDPWTLVPADVPSSGYNNDFPTTPQEKRSKANLPATPTGIRSPPGVNNSEVVHRGGSTEPPRRKPVQVPANWLQKYTYVPTKPDHKPLQSPPANSIMRHGAKSIPDMRAAFNKHPSSLQPGGRASRAPPSQPPLPPLRPSTGGNQTSSFGGSSLTSASPCGGAHSPHSYPEQTASEIARSVLSPSGSYGNQTAITNASPSTAIAGYLQDPLARPHSALGDSGSPQLRYTHSPQISEPTYDAFHRQPSAPSHAYSNSGTFSYREEVPRPAGPPPHDINVGPATVDRAFFSQRTPPRSPVGPSTRVQNGLSENAFISSGSLPGDGLAKRGAIDEDSSSSTTLRVDDRTWLAGFINEELVEGTARLQARHPLAPVQQLPTPPSTTEIVSTLSPASRRYSFADGPRDDDESDSDGEGRDALFWAIPPTKQDKPAEFANSRNRPPLPPLSIESSPSSQPNGLPAIYSHDYGKTQSQNQSPPFLVSPPPSSREPRTPRRQDAQKKKNKDRISKFDNNFDVTWAPRPPPEVMYERLEEYFPEHDLDKPVIEAASGGTSPTATELPALPAPPKHFRHKKSIRVVAAEHRRQLDRNSRGDDSTVAPTSRKRHTKMWGGKLEELTTEQGKGSSSSTVDPSTSGARPIFRWVRGELIGKGTYGRVYLALNATTGEMIAVKQVEIPRTASDKEDSRQMTVVEALKLESETLKDLDHPNIVSYLGFEETPTFLSIFLEYVPGGSIASCLRKHGRFDEEVTKSFTGQILEGLEYLHSRNILHRDLKADNILVETSGICKISDFGISKRTEDINMAEAYTSMQGTVFWMAPEVVNSNLKGYNSKIDIWSVGCVVFEMWTGQRPWSGQEAMAVLIRLYQTKQPPPVPQGVVLSALADDFRLQCFAADPDMRPSATELRRHPYLELMPGWSFNGFK